MHELSVTQPSLEDVYLELTAETRGMSEHALEEPVRRARPQSASVAWRRAAWRQYRLERKMFWRNPSAAFFNFLLPLIFLALFGAIFAERQGDLQVIVPGIAGMAVMSTTFSALAMTLTYLRESGVLKRVRGTPLPTSAYLAGIAGNAITNTALQVGLIIGGRLARVRARLAAGLGGAGRVRRARRGLLRRRSASRSRTRSRTSTPRPAYVNAAFLPLIFISGVFYDADNAPGFLRGIAEALPLKHLIDGLSGAIVTGEGLSAHAARAGSCSRSGRRVGIVLAVRGFSWDARRANARLGAEMPDPFFIVGNDRSGTTMLRLIVDRGADAAVPPESMFLTDFAAAFDAGGPRDEQAAARLMREVWEHPKVRLWELPAAAARGAARAERRRTPTASSSPRRSRPTPRGTASSAGATRRRTTSTTSTTCCGSGRARASSCWCATGATSRCRCGGCRSGPTTPGRRRSGGRAAIRAGARAQREHPDAVLTVRYEDLAERPREEVQRLCGFLGLGYDDGHAGARARRPRADRARPGGLVPDAVQRHQHERGRPLEARDEPARPARLRRARGRRARAARLRGRGRRRVRASRARQARWFHYHNELMRNVNFLRLRLVQERGRELRFALARRLRDPVKRAGSCSGRLSTARGRRGRTRPSRRAAPLSRR